MTTPVPASQSEAQRRLVLKALEVDHSALPELFQGLLTEVLTPTMPLRHEESLDKLQEVTSLRELVGTPAIQVDRFGDQVRRLVRSPDLLRAFLQDLSSYERAWGRSTVSSPSINKSASWRSEVISACQRHPASMGNAAMFGFPTAALFDIWNRSPHGTYVSDRPAVKGLFEGGNGDFVTLCHLPLWRESISRHAYKIAQRVCPTGEKLNVIMIGDGAGELGAAVAEHLRSQQQPIRLIHIDISPGMLDRQKLRYASVGMEGDDLVSIQGNLLNCQKLLRSHVPDITSGLFILNEIFDDLRTHACWSDQKGSGEMYTIVTGSGSKIDTSGFGSQDVILQNLPRYLPFYGTKSATPVMRSFCPEAITLLREMLSSIDTGGVIIGDYGWEFINDVPKTRPQHLPYRVYGPELGKGRSYTAGFDHPCSITADVHPAILYFAEAFGGRVDFLGSAEEFVSAMDPAFSESIPNRLETYREIFEGSRAVSIREYAEARLSLTVMNPSMFAGVILKDVAS